MTWLQSQLFLPLADTVNVKGHGLVVTVRLDRPLRQRLQGKFKPKTITIGDRTFNVRAFGWPHDQCFGPTDSTSLSCVIDGE